MKKVMLFINGSLGAAILDFLLARQDTVIHAVVVNSWTKTSENFINLISTKISETNREIKLYQYSGELWESQDFLEKLHETGYGISALFSHIFPKEIICKFDGNLINLHPSLLPIGRGADPVFWSIIEGNPQGASIHRIDRHIDTGEILVQEQIDIHSWLNSGQVYTLVIDKLYELFTNFYPNWTESTPSTPQVGPGSYHESRELSEIKSRVIDASGVLFQQLNMIQALTYSDGTRAKIVLPNQQVYEISLNLKRIER